MTENMYRHKIMNEQQDAMVDVWNIVKIAEDLPQVFNIHTAKKNGQKSLRVRNFNGIAVRNSAERMAEHFERAWKIKNRYAEDKAAGIPANLLLHLPAGTLILSDDMTEFVLSRLPEIIGKGWTLS